MSVAAAARYSIFQLASRGASNAFISQAALDINGRQRLTNLAELSDIQREEDRRANDGLDEELSVKRERSQSQPPRISRLAGRFLAAKDNISSTQFPTTCASGILEGFRSPINATAVDILEKMGMSLVGKTNMDEFGMGSYSTNSRKGPVKNKIFNGEPRSAGGSSGGSALAILARMCDVALGTDTGGSIRIPAAYTKTVGFKPSYGMISRYGIIPYANSLDTVGIIGRKTSHVINVFRTLAQYDDKDPTSIKPPTRERISELKDQRREAEMEQSYQGFQGASSSDGGNYEAWQSRRRIIGVPQEYVIEELSEPVREVWIRCLSQLEARGHHIVPISLPHTKVALSAYYVLALAEASSNLAKYDGVCYGPCDTATDKAIPNEVLFERIRGAGFSSEVQRRILLGTYSLCSEANDNYFVQAQKVRRLIQQDFDSVFRLPNALHDDRPDVPGEIDYIVSPTAPTAAPTLDQVATFSPLEAYLNDVFTVPASLAGLPAVSVPGPLGPSSSVPENMGIGIQVVGQFGDDIRLLGFAGQEIEPIYSERVQYLPGNGRILR